MGMIGVISFAIAPAMCGLTQVPLPRWRRIGVLVAP